MPSSRGRMVLVVFCILLLTVTSSPAAGQQQAAAIEPQGSSMPAGNTSITQGMAAEDLGVAKSNTTQAGTQTSKGTEYSTTTAAESACCAALRAIGFVSELPVVILDSPGANLTVQKNDEYGTMCTCGAPDGDDYDDVSVEFGYRGSSSVVDYMKKSYNIKSVPKNKGDSPDIKWLGMPKHTDWYAYGPENDHAMSRNWMAYKMWRQTGRWGSRTVWIELFVVTDNKPLSMEHYQGLYMGGEKIARGKRRVDVNKYDPLVDITGGFIFRIEHGKVKNAPVFDTRLSQQLILLDYPKHNVTPDTLTWLNKYVDDYERELLAPSTPPAYSKWVTSASLVDYFLVTEMIKTSDGYRGSVYFSKSAERPVEMGPVWDANESMGLCCGYPIEGWQNGGRSDGISGGSAISSNGWLFNICTERRRCPIDPLNGLAQWYLALWKLPGFRAATLARWKQLRANALSDEWISAEIAKQAALIQNATNRNYVRWAPAYIHDNVPLEQPTWTQEFAASTKFLTDWLVARAQWLDAEIAKEAAAVGVALPTQNATAAVLAAPSDNGTASEAATQAAEPAATVPGSVAGVAPLSGSTQARPIPAASGR